MKKRTSTHLFRIAATNPLEFSASARSDYTAFTSLLLGPFRVALSVKGPITEASVNSVRALLLKGL